MTTPAYPPQRGSLLHLTTDEPRHEITQAEAARILTALAKEGVHVVPMVDDHVLHLWPQELLSIAQEVTVLRAFAAVTDSRIAWHEAAG